jgi:paraquat-inducible protein B
MSKKASPTMVGAFVIGATFLLIGALVLFSSGRLLENRPKFVCFFSGSVKGLNVGSPVNFRGVRVGSVTDLTVNVDVKDLESYVPVFFELDPDRFNILNLPDGNITGENMDRLIEEGLKIQLDLQSMVTGQLLLNMDFMPEEPIKLSGIDMGVPEIPTVPTPLQQLSKKLQSLRLDEMFQRISSSIEGLEKIINAPEVMDSIRGIKETIAGVDRLVDNVNRKLGPLLSSAERTMNNAGAMFSEATTLVRNVDAQVEPIGEDVDSAAKSLTRMLDTLDAQVKIITQTIQQVAGSAQGTLDQATSTLVTIDETAGDERINFELTRVMEEVSRAVRALRILAESLEQRPDALIRGKGSSGGE